MLTFDEVDGSIFYVYHDHLKIALIAMPNTLNFLRNREARLFILGNIFPPRPPRLFNLEKFSTLDMNYYVVKLFFQPPLWENFTIRPFIRVSPFIRKLMPRPSAWTKYFLSGQKVFFYAKKVHICL